MALNTSQEKKYTGYVIRSEMQRSEMAAWNQWLEKLIEFIKTNPEIKGWRVPPSCIANRDFEHDAITYFVIGRIFILDKP